VEKIALMVISLNAPSPHHFAAYIYALGDTSRRVKVLLSLVVRVKIEEKPVVGDYSADVKARAE